MMRWMRRWAVPCLATVVALGLVPGRAGDGHAAPVAQGQARIAVAVFPDLAGPGPGSEGCPGCDGAFTAEDTAANAADPLPALEVVLKGADGTELDSNTTSGLANGRQVTFFSVEAAGDYLVDIQDLPIGWEACPDVTLARELGPDDFDETTGFASVEFHLWRGCPADVVAPEPPREEPLEPVSEEPEDAHAAETGATAEISPTVIAPAAERPATHPTATSAGVLPTPGRQAWPTLPPADEPPLGSIRGVVFVDVDGDGRLDAGEPGFPGASVRLVGLAESRDEVTAGAGTYAFGVLAPGSYDVYVTVPAGFTTTTPDHYLGIAVDGGTVLGIDFGLLPPEALEMAEAAAVAAATATPVPDTLAEPPALPSTGVQLQPRGRQLVALAVAAALLGALGLALETRLGRRSTHTGEGGEDV